MSDWVHVITGSISSSFALQKWQRVGHSTHLAFARTIGFDWVDKHGIEIRGVSGSDHYAWKGGGGYYYGSSWYENRRKALHRDQHRCQRCGMTEPAHLREFGQQPHVHHIIPFLDHEDHDKANRLENLITLCQECHVDLEGLPIDTSDL